MKIILTTVITQNTISTTTFFYTATKYVLGGKTAFILAARAIYSLSDRIDRYRTTERIKYLFCFYLTRPIISRAKHLFALRITVRFVNNWLYNIKQRNVYSRQKKKNSRQYRLYRILPMRRDLLCHFQGWTSATYADLTINDDWTNDMMHTIRQTDRKF